MSRSSRRSFLKTVSLSAAGVALSPRSWAQVAGANSDIRVAQIGLGNRSERHLLAYNSLPGVRIVALCDPDSDRLQKAARAQHDLGKDAQTFADIRELLARPDIDAVSITTPNHWHSLIAIWACQAGKDVYVEKPVSHNIWEGRQEVTAAAKYSRVMQAGTQARSRPDVTEAVSWVHAGNLGRVQKVTGLCYKRRKSIGLTHGPQPVPASVNYDLWTGPAPLVPLRRKRFHYDWHWFWPTGCGDLGNQGIHQMDVARWFLGDPGLAPHTLSVGGRFGYVDDAETPNTQIAVHDYPQAPLIFEVRGLSAHAGTESMDRYPNSQIGTNVGVVVHCEGGTLVAANGTRFDTGESKVGSHGAVAAFDRDGKVMKEFPGVSSIQTEALHFGNFLAAVRNRKPESLRAPIEGGHLSSALCHTSNISYRVGRTLLPGEIRERVKDNPAMSEAYGRMLEHLGTHDVDLEKNRIRLGMPLSVDPGAERFVGDDAANALLTRNYRHPYVVPNLA